MLNLRIARGRCLPLGASAQPDGVNFALLCRHGTAVFLVLYPLERPRAARRDRPASAPQPHRRSLARPGRRPAAGFLLRLARRRPAAAAATAYDPNIVLLDPAATALSDGAVWGRSRETEPHASPAAAASSSAGRSTGRRTRRR